MCVTSACVFLRPVPSRIAMPIWIDLVELYLELPLETNLIGFQLETCACARAPCG